MAAARTQQGSVPTGLGPHGSPHMLLAHARSCEGHQHFTACPVHSAVGTGGARGARQPGAAAVEEQSPRRAAAGPWGSDLPHRSQHSPMQPAGPHNAPMQPAQPPHSCSPWGLRLLPSPAQVPGGQGIIFISFPAGLRLWGVSFTSRAFPQAAFNHYLKASLKEPRLDHNPVLAQGNISSPHSPVGRVLPCPGAILATTSSAGDKPWETGQGSEQAGLISTSQGTWLQPLSRQSC